MKSLARFVAATHNRARGQVGERAAGKWLVRRGYEIVRSNYRTRSGEIDLIARDGECLCFIEIKARRGGGFGGPLAAVPPAKQRRIARAAAQFLSASGWAGPCRFDVLGLEGIGEQWRFRLVRDAFSAPSG